MARSTGPILAMGALALGNKTIIHGQAVDWRIPIATGFAAGAFALMEKGWEGAAVGVAWLALVVSVFTRLDSRTPSLVESLERFWSGGDLKQSGRAAKQ